MGESISNQFQWVFNAKSKCCHLEPETVAVLRYCPYLSVKLLYDNGARELSTEYSPHCHGDQILVGRIEIQLIHWNHKIQICGRCQTSAHFSGAHHLELASSGGEHAGAVCMSTSEFAVCRKMEEHQMKSLSDWQRAYIEGNSL